MPCYESDFILSTARRIIQLVEDKASIEDKPHKPTAQEVEFLRHIRGLYHGIIRSQLHQMGYDTIHLYHSMQSFNKAISTGNPESDWSLSRYTFAINFSSAVTNMNEFVKHVQKIKKVKEIFGISCLSELRKEDVEHFWNMEKLL